jgi:hypothetical protein
MIFITAQGCSYLAGPYGQAVSLKSYDGVSIESITAAPGTASPEWLEPALRQAIQTQLDASPLWQTPDARGLSNIAAVDIEITKADEIASGDAAKGKYSLACNITVSDGKSGEKLGKAKLSASGTSQRQVQLKPGPKTATAQLGEKIFKTLTSAKLHSRKRQGCPTCH